MFLLNHVLNYYLINLKVKKIEEFTNQITTTKNSNKPKEKDTSILTNKDNLNSILSLNKVINEDNKGNIQIWEIRKQKN